MFLGNRTKISKGKQEKSVATTKTASLLKKKGEELTLEID